MMVTPKNRSVMKAFSLLQSFRGPEEWLTSSELSRRARLPEASGYRLMQTLEGIGAVVRDARGRYRPGMLLLSLSQGVVEQDLWNHAPQGLLDALAGDLDVAVQVGTVDDGMVTYVALAGRPRMAGCLAVGMQFEAYCTAIGKVLLASLDDEALDAFLADGELIALTANTIIDRDALCRHLALVRLEGSAVDMGEMVEDLSCVAVPIRNATGRIVAAISASDHIARLSDVRRKHLRLALSETAAAVSARLFPCSRDLMPGAAIAGAAPGSPPGSAEARIAACGTVR